MEYIRKGTNLTRASKHSGNIWGHFGNIYSTNYYIFLLRELISLEKIYNSGERKVDGKQSFHMVCNCA